MNELMNRVLGHAENHKSLCQSNVPIFNDATSTAEVMYYMKLLDDFVWEIGNDNCTP
jgi:hypothetical protein